MTGARGGSWTGAVVSMNRERRFISAAGFCLAVCLGWLSAGWLPGQEAGSEDPFGAAPAAPPAAPPAAAEEDPFGSAPSGAAPAKPPADAAPKKADETPAESVPTETDPIVLGVREYQSRAASRVSLGGTYGARSRPS